MKQLRIALVGAMIIGSFLWPRERLYADWFNVISGSVHTNTLLDSNIPGNSEYFSIDESSTGLRIGDSGVITHDDASPDVGNGSETPDISGGSGMDWVFQSGAFPRMGNQYGYAYYSSTLAPQIPLPNNMLNGTCANMQPPGIYFRNAGTFSINCPLPQVPLQSGKYIFLFSGNVNIRTPIHLPNQDDFVAIIAGRDIVVQNIGVTSMNNPALQGVYIADRQFETSNGNDTLYMEGAFIAWDSNNSGRSFILRRDDGSPNDEKEVFIFRPELLFALPDAMKRENSAWEEVSP